MKKLELYSFDDALRSAIENAKTINKIEIIMLDSVLGRVLANDVICQKNLPSFDNSAMDGFACRHDNEGKRLKIVDTIFAGDIPREQLDASSCYKIMTGAQVPKDADTIVPIEDCIDVTDEYVTMPQKLKKGSALRLKGEEQQKGSVLIEKGTKLTFSHIALLSAQGIVALEVYRSLSIAVVSTGDEIREPWQEANEDEIYNANAFGITALLKHHGFDPTYIGSIPDDLDKSIEFISKLKSYDTVITTGGISMGDADFLEEAFIANGLEPLFHGINVKPGRPTMMGIMQDTFVMAMPGNPMTTLLNIFLLSIPVLRKLSGENSSDYTYVYADISQSLKLKPTRTNLVLGSIVDGIFHVTDNNKIGSGMLTPLTRSNAVMIAIEGISTIDEGMRVPVVLF